MTASPIPVQHFPVRRTISICLGVILYSAYSSGRADEQDETIRLIDEEGEVDERALETLLAPGEFSGRRFVHLSTGEEAAYSLDSSLSAMEPFAELHPERLPWPRVAGLELVAESPPLKLRPASQGVDDDLLDRGFTARWILRALGQRFDPKPHFAVEVVEAEVIADGDGKRLFFWRADPPPAVCRRDAKRGSPNCDLSGVSREARALALSPDGALLAVALGGLRPRLEIYDVRDEPRLVWQSLFAKGSGGAVEVAFSADREWVVALTGRGRMHRFAAASGGQHMTIPSTGRTARAIPPGRIVAVAGDAGEVTFWYLADGTIAWRLPPRRLRGPIDRLAPSGDGRRFATLEYDKEKTVVRVWELGRRAALAQIEVDPFAVADIALDGQGESLFVTHETRGLLTSRIQNYKGLQPLGGRTGERCRGRLRWIPGLERLSCSIPGGELQIDPQGRLMNELITGVRSSDWIVAASSGGRRLAAIGGGHLLVWWMGTTGKE